MKQLTVAIDVMGGDHGVDVIIPACIMVLKQHPHLKLLLVGDEAQINQVMQGHGALYDPGYSIIHTTEVVGMDELPSAAMRNKKKSSMRVAIDLVKTGTAQACVSAGNTGALMGISRFVLRTLPGIDRPAIIAEMPTKVGKTRVIDLGANVDSCAEYLFQFAVMGAALIQAIDQKQKPRVALLNIGVEEIKGNDQVKQAALMLAGCEFIDYIGYREGNNIYTGDVDLIVCDGFVGNVALKASEGIARLMLTVLKEAFYQNRWMKFVGLLARPALNQLKMRMDPARYNGATLLGLNGIVIKSHGGANTRAFAYAIEEAMIQVNHNVTELVRSQINEFINNGVVL